MTAQTNFHKSFQRKVERPSMQSENFVLAALPPDIYKQLMPHLKQVSLEQGKLICAPNEPIETVYFPIDCLLSLTITMNDGSTAETGMIGRQDMFGLNAVMSGTSAQTTCSVQVAGSAFKADAKIWRQEFNRNQELREVLLRSAQALAAQVSQTAACNRLHLLDQRLARWLLEVQSRIGNDNLKLTHEFISEMLGVRRAGVTLAAQKLQDSGIIQYNRGHIKILDQHGLEASACECFSVIQQEYDRLLLNQNILNQNNR